MCTNKGGGRSLGGGSAGRTQQVQVLQNGAPALDRDLIRRANEAGTFVDYGDSTSRQYNKNVDEIKGMDMTTDERKAAYSQLHTLTENQLKAESQARGAYAAGMGPARFNRQAIQRNQSKALSASDEVRSFMDGLRRSQEVKAKEREQKAFSDAAMKAIKNGDLSFTINGETWVRKTRRGKNFQLQR